MECSGFNPLLHRCAVYNILGIARISATEDQRMLLNRKRSTYVAGGIPDPRRLLTFSGARLSNVFVKSIHAPNASQQLTVRVHF